MARTDPVAVLRALDAVAREALHAINESGHRPDREEPGSCVWEYPCAYRRLADALATLRAAVARETEADHE